MNKLCEALKLARDSARRSAESSRSEAMEAAWSTIYGSYSSNSAAIYASYSSRHSAVEGVEYDSVLEFQISQVLTTLETL